MQRPLLIVAISYVLGIIIGVYLQKSIPLVVLIALITVITAIRLKKCNKIIAVIMVTIIVATGKTVYLNNKYEKFYKDFNSKEITAVATICDDIKETDYRYTTVVKIDQMKGDTNNKYKGKKFLLYIRKSKKIKLEYGDQVRISGFYDEAEGRRNYKGSNYQEYLKNKKIYGILNCENELKVLKKKNLSFANMFINKLRNRLKENFIKILDKEEAGLAIGILLGDSSDIDEDIKESFKNCSLSHMLAVSGAHLSYLVLGLNFILNEKLIGKRR